MGQPHLCMVLQVCPVFIGQSPMSQQFRPSSLRHKPSQESSSAQQVAQLPSLHTCSPVVQHIVSAMQRPSAHCLWASQHVPLGLHSVPHAWKPVQHRVFGMQEPSPHLISVAGQH
jgi:hypothetical protein